MEWIDLLQQDWAFRALLASIMVGISCGILGAFIVLRNMSLVGDALSHAILPGVVFAFVLFGGYSVWGFFLGSVAAGLLAALLITWIQNNIQTRNDAAIGIVFTAMFSIGVIGISHLSRNEGAHIDLKDFLFGNVLGVSDQDLVLSFLVLLVVVAGIILFYRPLFITTFQSVVAKTMGIRVELVHYFLMLLLSFAVVSALQTVGVILVVAMLITPASTALLLSDRLKNVIFLSALIGIIAAIGGMVAAILFDTTPGPAIAIVATLMYLLAAIFAPEKGFFVRYWIRTKERWKVESEDVLKEAYSLQLKEELTLESLGEKLGWNKGKLNRFIQQLKQQDLIQKSEFQLTSKGRKKAEKLVRAHRLWETYLVNKMGMDASQIHEEAERLEHHLTEEILSEVDEVLDFPSLDPHGSPIPDKIHFLAEEVKREVPKDFEVIDEQQSSKISSQLWKLGVGPNSRWKRAYRMGQEVHLEDRTGKEIRIPFGLASLIEVRSV